jgi:enhancing lycopene biosynthesis protein 2
MIPKLYNNKPTMTIGEDQKIAKQMEELGANHVCCPATEIVVDQENKIISTPANMVASSISEVFIGIDKLVKEICRHIA